MDIDVWFDFTSDTKGFWNRFWERNQGLGGGGADPDSKSAMLILYHKLLCSKQLPNGEYMKLESDRCGYLRWKDFCFGSDSITATFRYDRCRSLLEKVASTMPDYKAFVEGYLHKLYTIGGEIILPAGRNGLNVRRGMHPRIKDRWDLTLECIRRYYKGEESPLSKTLQEPMNQAFFALFVDFKGFVDFFFLQDCVNEDYTKVILKYDSSLFDTFPLPDSVDSYLNYVQKELGFVENRNERIKKYIATKGLSLD